MVGGDFGARRFWGELDKIGKEERSAGQLFPKQTSPNWPDRSESFPVQSIWDQDGQGGAARSSQSTRVAVRGGWLAGRSQLGVKLAQMSR